MSPDGHDSGNTSQGRAQGANNNQRQVLRAEVIDNRESGGNGSSSYSYRAFYRRGMNGPGYGAWTFTPIDNAGCSSAFITFLLFLMCLGSYGLLAGIGFFVFHLIGSILGSVYSARQLMRGLPFNLWAWRIGNWIVAFFLTVWLAGGFD